MRRLFALLLASVWSVAGASPALDNVDYWMTRMLEAADAVSYQGELVHLQAGSRVQSMRIVRRNGSDGYNERLLTLDGTPSEVFRDGSSISCILPGGRESLAGQRIPRNPFPAAHWVYSEALHRHYEFLDLGEDRVAGRSCKVIGIHARDAHRYGYRLWVDVETGLLLKSEIVDSDGKLLDQVAYTRVDLPSDVDEAALSPTLQGETLSWRVMARSTRSEGAAWKVGRMPAGFTFQSSRERNTGEMQQVFSDGLATVSIFVSPDGHSQEGLMGTSRMGSVSAFGTTIDGRHITVVGEVPLETVQAIGESLALDR